MNKARTGVWSPYVAGGVSGLIAVLSTLFTGKFYGASTSFVRTAGMVEKSIVPDYVQNLGYFAKYTLAIDWQWMFVAGIFLGALVSSLVGKTFHIETIPPMWRQQHGKTLWKRGMVAFFGGIVAMIGARLAGGCPSGHGLSGLSQMAVSGYLSLVFFFIGGVITAHLVYRRQS